jgi:hypothetical protein
MNEYQSLYTWAMERQMALREEAEIRRMVRQARRRKGLPAALSWPRLEVLAGLPQPDERPTAKSA